MAGLTPMEAIALIGWGSLALAAVVRAVCGPDDDEDDDECDLGGSD